MLCWLQDGKYLHKKNTFTDFIACAEHLIKVSGDKTKRAAALHHFC
jgi:oligopeptidase B